jgi:hypothetical protein
MSVLCERTTYVQKDGEIIKILKLDLEYFISMGWSSGSTANTSFTITTARVPSWGHIIKVGK